MKPFDIVIALSGLKKVVNSSNEQFQLVEATLFDQDLCFARACNGSSGPQLVTINGLMSDGTQLYIAGDKHVKYVNIYPTTDVSGFVSGKVLHESEELAREVAGANMVAVVRVEFEA